jgi:hypothetical protein
VGWCLVRSCAIGQHWPPTLCCGGSGVRRHQSPALEERPVAPTAVLPERPVPSFVGGGSLFGTWNPSPVGRVEAMLGSTRSTMVGLQGDVAMRRLIVVAVVFLGACALITAGCDSDTRTFDSNNHGDPTAPVTTAPTDDGFAKKTVQDVADILEWIYTKRGTCAVEPYDIWSVAPDLTPEQAEEHVIGPGVQPPAGVSALSSYSTVVTYFGDDTSYSVVTVSGKGTLWGIYADPGSSGTLHHYMVRDGATTEGW